MSAHAKRSTGCLLWTLALLAAALAGPARALEFGPATTSTALGASLDFSVELRGGAPDAACVAADVALGGVLLPPQAVSVSLLARGTQAWVRVRTRLAVHEPVVTVVVSAGCPARATKRFTVLADPPEAVVPPAPPEPPTAAGPEPSAPTAAAAARLDRAAVRESRVPVEPTGRPQVSSALSGGGGSPLPAPGGALLRMEAPVVRAAEAAPAAAAKAAAASPAAPAAPVLVAPPSASSPASGVVVSASAGDAASAVVRLQELERSLLALRVDARLQRENLARLESALSDARGEALLAWGTAGGALLALAVLAGWTLRRRRGAGGDAVRWRADLAQTDALHADEPTLGAADPPVLRGSARGTAQVDAAGTADTPYTGALANVAPTAVASPGSAPVGTDAAGVPRPYLPEGEAERTRLLAPSESAVSAPLQTATVEEALDLEQQVEFLTVLGREQDAASLLEEHLQSTGGTHPMPYLRLMQLHRRLGQREDYERVRARFNERFNAVAAAFGAAPAPARTLDDHPQVMRRIEQAWPRPLDALTLLENLMFRGSEQHPLDVGALEEVVFLHGLAGDLLRHEDASAVDVDVLLPLGEPEDRDSTVARPSAAGNHAADPWPTLSETAFDTGGLAMEPLAPPRAAKTADPSR